MTFSMLLQTQGHYVPILGTVGANHQPMYLGVDTTIVPEGQYGFAYHTSLFASLGGFEAKDIFGYDPEQMVATSAYSYPKPGKTLNVLEASDTPKFGSPGPDLFFAETATTDIRGAGGDDWLSISTAGASIFGEAGDDHILGGTGDDVIDGGDGDDQLTAAGGVNRFYGGAGDDKIYGGDGDSSIVGISGQDQYFGGNGRLTLDLHGSETRVFGNATHVWNEKGDSAKLAGVDTIIGSSFDDQLAVNALEPTSHDFIWTFWLIYPTPADFGFAPRPAALLGRSGDDLLTGGDGIDWLYGNSGDDVLFGEAGDDYLVGGGGRDLISGGDGADYAHGRTGRDTLVGGSGDDRLHGGGGQDRLRGQADNDRLFGEAGDDRLMGGGGNDHLQGGAGDDRISGSIGDDRISGGAGTDRMQGGAGSDVFRFEPKAGINIIYDFEAGNDMLDLTAFGLRRFATDVEPLLRTLNGDTVIDFTPEDRVFLRGVAADELSQGDVIIV